MMLAASRKLDLCQGQNSLTWTIQPATPQLPSKIPQIPSDRDHKALKGLALEGVGGLVLFKVFLVGLI